MDNILYKTEQRINEHIAIRIPTVGDVVDNENDYYGNIALIISTPYDMMVQLDNMKIDFTSINEWDLFCLLFKELQSRDLSLVFGNIDLKDFDAALDKQSGNIILVNNTTGAVIDRLIHGQISNSLRKILNIEKNKKRPGNAEAKAYMIERARKRMERRNRMAEKSQLESHIVTLVNTAEFPYDYNSVRDITIYQFNKSLRQIIKKIKYDKLMIGCYAGTVSMKELDPKELDWTAD